jgi:hypothetical protein
VVESFIEFEALPQIINGWTVNPSFLSSVYRDLTALLDMVPPSITSKHKAAKPSICSSVLGLHFFAILRPHSFASSRSAEAASIDYQISCSGGVATSPTLRVRVPPISSLKCLDRPITRGIEAQLGHMISPSSPPM